MTALYEYFSNSIIPDKSYFIGIDPSLNSSGLVIINERSEVLEQKVILTQADCYLNAEQRILDIISNFSFIKSTNKIDMVCVEDLPFGTIGSTVYERAGLLYCLLTKLFEHEVPYTVVHPSTLKNWVLNSEKVDNSVKKIKNKKEMIIKAVEQRWGLVFDNDNICDAYCLSRFGMKTFNGK